MTTSGTSRTGVWGTCTRSIRTTPPSLTYRRITVAIISDKCLPASSIPTFYVEEKTMQSHTPGSYNNERQNPSGIAMGGGQGTYTVTAEEASLLGRILTGYLGDFRMEIA